MLETRASRAALGALVLLLAALPGCGSRVIDLRDPADPDPVPAPSSPTAAVLRLQWAWNRRDPEPLRDLIASDYRYFGSPPDSGSGFEIFRRSELAFATNLFVTGTANLPPATAVTFLLASPITEAPSPIPGQDPRWHREIASGLHVGVRVPAGDYRVIGKARFGLVRGDSARIPQELLDRGFVPDSTRWWIERWAEEESVPPPGSRAAAEPAAAGRAQPSEPFSLSTLKAIYLGLPPPAPR